jgi:hypothetical protein
MKPDRRKIKLSFPATGESVIAEMLDDEAPQVCAHVWSILPIEHRMYHGMYSGAEVFALLDQPRNSRRRTSASSRCPARFCGSTTARPPSRIRRSRFPRSSSSITAA